MPITRSQHRKRTAAEISTRNDEEHQSGSSLPSNQTLVTDGETPFDDGGRSGRIPSPPPVVFNLSNFDMIKFNDARDYDSRRRSSFTGGLYDHPYQNSEKRYNEKRWEGAQRDGHNNNLCSPSVAAEIDLPTPGAAERFASYKLRLFHDQRCIPFDNKKFDEIRNVLEVSGLIQSVTDVYPYSPQVIREFYSNCGDLEYRSGVHLVFVRGIMYEFTPEAINSLYERNEDTAGGDWDEIDINSAVAVVSNRERTTWEAFDERHLSIVAYILYKLCCHNWIPKTEVGALDQYRIKLVAHIIKGNNFNLGQLIYDQILDIARRPEMSQQKLLFPNLISQLLNAQRYVPVRAGDGLYQGYPLEVVLDPATCQRSVDEEAATAPILSKELEIIASWVKIVKDKFEGGEYPTKPGSSTDCPP